MGGPCQGSLSGSLSGPFWFKSSKPNRWLNYSGPAMFSTVCLKSRSSCLEERIKWWVSLKKTMISILKL